MLQQLRVPLLIASVALVLYGAGMFWQGKQSVDTERRTRKPQAVTIDELVLNPPGKAGAWITLTNGGASVARGTLDDYAALMPKSGKDVPFAVYFPILSNRDAVQTESAERLDTVSPPVFLILRSDRPEHKQLLGTWGSVKAGDERTADAWLQQNKAALVLCPPFTGVLARQGRGAFDTYTLQKIRASMNPDGWVLIEGRTPPLAENAQVAIGLAWIMGVPTVWLFGLLLTGKLAPPDEDVLPQPTATATAAGAPPAKRTTVSSSSAMPVAPEPDTKTPRR